MNLLKIYTILLLTVNSYGYINYDNLKNKTEYSNIGFGSSGLDSPMAQDKQTETNTAISSTITVAIKDEAKQKQDISKISNDTEHAHYRVQEVNKEVLNIRKDVAGQVGATAFTYVAHTLYNDPKLKDLLPPKTLVHGIIGGIVSKIAGGEFKTGATGAVVGHEVAKLIIKQLKEEYKKGNINKKQLEIITKTSSMIAVAIVSSAAGDSSTDSLNAVSVGKNVVTNNDLAFIGRDLAGLGIADAKHAANMISRQDPSKFTKEYIKKYGEPIKLGDGSYGYIMEHLEIDGKLVPVVNGNMIKNNKWTPVPGGLATLNEYKNQQEKKELDNMTTIRYHSDSNNGVTEAENNLLDMFDTTVTAPYPDLWSSLKCGLSKNRCSSEALPNSNTAARKEYERATGNFITYEELENKKDYEEGSYFPGMLPTNRIPSPLPYQDIKRTIPNHQYLTLPDNTK